MPSRVVIADAHNSAGRKSRQSELFLRESPESKVIFLSIPEEEGFRIMRVKRVRCAVQTSGQELIQMVRSAVPPHGPRAS